MLDSADAYMDSEGEGQPDQQARAFHSQATSTHTCGPGQERAGLPHVFSAARAARPPPKQARPRQASGRLLSPTSCRSPITMVHRFGLHPQVTHGAPVWDSADAILVQQTLARQRQERGRAIAVSPPCRLSTLSTISVHRPLHRGSGVSQRSTAVWHTTGTLPWIRRHAAIKPGKPSRATCSAPSRR